MIGGMVRPFSSGPIRTLKEQDRQLNAIELAFSDFPDFVLLLLLLKMLFI